MEQHIVWSRWDEPGLEHLRLMQTEHGIFANSLMLRVEANTAFRIGYAILCDTAWNIREVNIELLDASGQGLQLRTDAVGYWETYAGDSLPQLDGCLDIDISVTPFTNTIAIRRLGLAVGASAEIIVASIKVPEMQVIPTKQRYTCLGSGAQGAVYRYENLHSRFTAELDVDRNGLIINYPGIYKRVWANRDSTIQQGTHS